MTDNRLAFSQKKRVYRTDLRFDDDKLNAVVEDASSRVQLDVPYGDIYFGSKTVVDKMEALRSTAFFFLVAAVVSAVTKFTNWLPFELFWNPGSYLLFAGLSWWGYRKTEVAFTVLDTSEGTLPIQQDQQHDQIMDLVTERRRTALRGQLFSVESQNMMATVQTLDKLYSNNVISKGEYDERVAKQHASSFDNDSSEPRLLN